jgi:hypothetical protein
MIWVNGINFWTQANEEKVTSGLFVNQFENKKCMQNKYKFRDGRGQSKINQSQQSLASRACISFLKSNKVTGSDRRGEV